MRRHFVVPLAVALLACAALVSAQAEAPAAAAPAHAAKPAHKPAEKPAAKPSHDSLTLVRQRGKLIACVPAHAPWLINAADGSFKGFSVDLASQLAQDLGVGVAYVVNDASGLLSSLSEGECDVIAGGLSATPERALFAHFSDAVARHDIVLVADKETGSGWRRPQDLDRPETSVGVVAGSALVAHAKRLFAKAKLVELPDWNALGAALSSGQVKAALLSEPLSGLAVKLAPEKLVAPLSEPLGSRGEAFAVRRGDLEFLAYLDTWVDAHRNDGWLKERRQQWFVDLAWVDQP